jgi:hypothetical protein
MLHDGVKTCGFQYKIYAASAAGDLHKLDELFKTVPVNYKISGFGKQTALHIAADQGHYHLCQWLLAKGAYPNARDAAGNTPVFCSVNSGNMQVVSLLLEYGADLNVVSDYGMTIEDFISPNAQLSRQQILDRLKRCGYVQCDLRGTRTRSLFDD